MKLKFVAAASAAVLLSTGSAFAVVTPLGQLDDVGASIFGSTSAAGLSLQSFSFSLTPASDVIGGIFAFNNNYGSIGMSISDGLMTWNDSDATDGFNFSNLHAGAYTMTVFAVAKTAKVSSYGGYIAATSLPVPEPETYAMMLAGLGALGFLARRRRND